MINKIKAEADVIVCDKERRIAELEQELAEALAYAERLREALNMQMAISGGVESGDSVYKRSMAVLAETPPAALAALKADYIHSICNNSVTAKKLLMATDKGLKITGIVTDDGRILHNGKAQPMDAMKAEWQADAVQSILDECEHWSLMSTWGILVEDISEKLEGLYKGAQEAGDE